MVERLQPTKRLQAYVVENHRSLFLVGLSKNLSNHMYLANYLDLRLTKDTFEKKPSYFDS